LSGDRAEADYVSSISPVTQYTFSDGYFVKTSGLRWLSLMLLADIPWAQRVWASVFFHRFGASL